jgi:hypothetical protein
MTDKLTLADIDQALEHKISGGSDYQWNCYGPNARYLDYTISGLDVTGSVIYDTQTQEVYEACLCNGPDDLAYRWSNPDYYKAHAKEAKKRGVDSAVAWDNVKYKEVDVDSWIQIALDLVGESPVEEEHLGIEEVTGTNVQIDLPDRELLQLCLMAHERDITLNALVNNILREYIDNYGTI